MGMLAAHTDWTVEMLDAPGNDGQRHEIIDGVSRRQTCAARIVVAIVQPDSFVVRVTNGKRPVYPFDLTDLLLAIEVESASNPRYDYQTKRVLYLQSGVPESTG